MRSTILAVAGLMSLAACAAALPARAQGEPGPDPTAAQPTLGREALKIGSHNFNVEVARTPREQQVGLMYRTDIPAGTGMLFVWPQPQESQMWMDHCPVPEDMIFIGPDNRIIHIAENTVPFSKANIDSGGIAKATLEVQGGLAAKLGIGVGDLVTSKDLGPPGAS